MRRAFIALALLALGACKGRDSGATGAPTKTIGVSLLTREQDFYRSLEAGLRDQAAKHGYKLIITTGDFDLAKQQSAIDNFLVQKVDAIILCPTDTKGIAPAIEKANAANIPVFTADIAAQGGRVVSHVASDNVAGGRLAADWLARAIGEKGDVGIIGQPELQSVIDREAGFREAIAKYPNVHVVANINGAGVRDRALRAADDMFQAHPNLAGLFAINDETALGALSSAQSHGLKKLVIVGYDATPEAVAAINAGTQLEADVAQDPTEIGRRTIDAIAAHFAGQQTPAVVAVPVKVVEKGTVQTTTTRPPGA